MKIWKTDHFKIKPGQRVVINGVPHVIVGYHYGGGNLNDTPITVEFKPEAKFKQ